MDVLRPLWRDQIVQVRRQYDDPWAIGRD